MGTEAWLLIALVVVGAIFLVVHAANLWAGLRAGRLAWYWRVGALLPPVTPVVAWMAGRRVAPSLWGAVLAVYVVLRALA